MTDELIYKELTQLGQQVDQATSPDEAVIETVANPQAGVSYVVRLVSPEFTSLCPITNQPCLLYTSDAADE